MNGAFAFERTVEPTVEPVLLAEMKRHLREYDSVTTNDDDIANLIKAGREWAEEFTGRALFDQTWRLTLGSRLGTYIGGDRVSGYTPGIIPFGRYEWMEWVRRGEIMLRKSPVLSIVSVLSVDDAGATTSVDAANYEVRERDSKWPRIVPLDGFTWPQTEGGLRITFRAGFADQDVSPAEGVAVVPVRFVQGIKLWVEAMYDRDEKLMPLLLKTAEDILRPERAALSLA